MFTPVIAAPNQCTKAGNHSKDGSKILSGEIWVKIELLDIPAPMSQKKFLSLVVVSIFSSAIALSTAPKAHK